MTLEWSLSPFELEPFSEITMAPSVRDAISGYLSLHDADLDRPPVAEMDTALQEALEAIERIQDPLFSYVVCVRLIAFYVGKLRELSWHKPAPDIVQ